MPLISLLKGSIKGKKPRLVTLSYNKRETFEKLKEAFIKALLLRHFNPNALLCVETNTSRYTIARIFS